MTLLVLIVTVSAIYNVGVINGNELNQFENFSNKFQSRGRALESSNIDIKMRRTHFKSRIQHFSRISEPFESRSIIPASCGTTVELFNGDIGYTFSDNSFATTNCEIKFRGPQGTTLNVLCPVVDLDKEGCKKEALFINDSSKNRLTACKDYGEASLVGTSNDVILRYRSKDSSTRDRGYFCMVSVQSDFKTGIDDSIVYLAENEIGYFISDEYLEDDRTKYTLYFRGPEQSKLKVLCPMVELHPDGCDEEILTLLDTEVDSNRVTACKVSCKTFLETTANDLAIFYRKKKGSTNVRGVYCIIIVDAAPPCDLTTEAPTTEAPTTVAPTAVAPTTLAPTTVAPTTVAPTTVDPTTVAPTTVAPTTLAPTTLTTTTLAPITLAPCTDPFECGKPFKVISAEREYVIGQDIDLIREHPWMCHITVVYDSGNEINCAGTIIAHDWLITAAHCIDPTAGEIASTTVRCGIRQLQTQFGQSFTVIETKYHPDEDVALLQLNATVELDRKVLIICLADEAQTDSANITQFIATGWEVHTERPTRLQDNLITIINNSFCNILHTSSNNTDANILCGETSGTDCQGTNGDALIIEISPRVWALAGIASIGTECTDNANPVEYAAIYPLLDWIDESTGITICYVNE